MLKKTLKISAIVLTILAIALLAYYFVIQSNTLISNGQKPSFSNLFPFGNGGVSTQIPFATSTPDTEATIQTAPFNQVVRLISNDPVAGEAFITTPEGDIVRYSEKATGHIVDVSTFNDAVNQVTNTTIPQLAHAYFTENGKGFIGQYINEKNTISTFYGSIIGVSSSTKSVGIVPLSSSITSITISPDTNSVASIEPTNQGSNVYISTPNGNIKKKIWVSPLSEIIPSFISDTSLGLTTKPDLSANGILLSVNTLTSKEALILSRIGDINTLPAYKKPYILVSALTSMFLYNTTSNTREDLIPYTFAEKCVWSPTQPIIYCAVPKTKLIQGSLDDWYKGLVSYSDDIWEYNINTHITHQLVTLGDKAGRPIDVSSISINPTGTLLMIMNKTDESLWTVKINP